MANIELKPLSTEKLEALKRRFEKAPDDKKGRRAAILKKLDAQIEKAKTVPAPGGDVHPVPPVRTPSTTHTRLARKK